MLSSTAQDPRLSTTAKTSSSTFSEISLLIGRLDDLRESSTTVLQLIRFGSMSIPLLADALLNGRPRSLPQPRCSLVKALAALRAYDVLVQYLKNRTAVTDPEVRFAEDSVINAAAHALEGVFSAEAYSALLDVARERSLPDVFEVLALYRRSETIPLFIRALEGDLSRAAAEQGIQLFGLAAKSYLLEEVLRPDPMPPDQENRSSLYRRRASLRLLETLDLDELERGRLLVLLSERDPELVMSIGKIILLSRNPAKCTEARQRLKALLPHAEWWLRDDIRELVRALEEASKQS